MPILLLKKDKWDRGVISFRIFAGMIAVVFLCFMCGRAFICWAISFHFYFYIALKLPTERGNKQPQVIVSMEEGEGF